MNQYIVTELGKRILMLLEDDQAEYFPETRDDLDDNEYVYEWGLLETLGLLVCEDGIFSLEDDTIEYTNLLAELSGKVEKFYNPDPEKLVQNKQLYLSNLERIGAIIPSGMIASIIPEGMAQPNNIPIKQCTTKRLKK